MKLYSWNVNGIRAVLRKDNFHPFVNSEKPDILCLQETKAQPGDAEVGLIDYHEYWHSAEKKGYSGTAIYSRWEPLTVTKGISDTVLHNYGSTADAFGDPNLEGRVLTAEYPDFYLVTVYTPNSKEDLSRIPLRYLFWDKAFLAYCQELEKTKPVIVCGDLNVAHTELDLANPKSNIGKRGFTTEERAGFQAFIDAGFIDTFRMFKQGKGFYTWWGDFAAARARNVGWRIDYFLVSAALKDKVINADVHMYVMGSDHCPVSLELDF